MSTIRFRPPWWGIALAMAGCAAGVALGNWQSGRAAEKRAAGAAAAVVLEGTFESKYTVLLENKFHHGSLGYHVIQPLRLATGRHVLVNRGWIVAPRDTLPAVRTPPGNVRIEGYRLERFARVLAPEGTKRAGPVWQHATVEEFARWSGLPMEPTVFEQHSGLEDGLVRDWPRPGSGVEKHESYALQWYSLAVLSVVLFIALNLKRGEREPT